MKNSDPLLFNKIAAAFLSVVLFVMLGNTIADGIYASSKPAKDVYVVAEVKASAEAEAAPDKADEGEAGMDFAAFFAKADAGKGAKVAKKCKACHTWDEGGKNKVGPNLYSVIRREIASVEGAKYSKALKAYAAENGDWSRERLIAFLAKPKAAVKGTSMGFAGLRKPKDIANLLAYFNEEFSKTPIDLKAQ